MSNEDKDYSEAFSKFIKSDYSCMPPISANRMSTETFNDVSQYANYEIARELGSKVQNTRLIVDIGIKFICSFIKEVLDNAAVRILEDTGLTETYTVDSMILTDSNGVYIEATLCGKFNVSTKLDFFGSLETAVFRNADKIVSLVYTSNMDDDDFDTVASKFVDDNRAK